MKANKIVIFFIMIILIISISTCFAANVKVQINGNIIDFTDENGEKVEAQTINSRTMVPLRKIFEVLGCDINWDSATKTVTANNINKTIKLTAGDKKATVIEDSQETSIDLDTPPTIVSNRTLVPLRFIAESLGCVVGWDSGKQTAIIIDFDEIAKLIANKSAFLYQSANDAEVASLIVKYFDDADSNNNQEIILKVTGSASNNPQETIANVVFDGKADLVNEIKTEEWNDFTYTQITEGNQTYLMSDNYVFSKMFHSSKGKRFIFNPEEFGFSKQSANNLKDWVKIVSNIDEKAINVDTYKTLKSDWQKFANTFFGGNKTLKADDFAYTFINLENIAIARTGNIALNTLLLLNKMAFRLNLDYQDMLSDYPTITYSFSETDANTIKIVLTLKNEYKERMQYEFSLSSKNI